MAIVCSQLQREQDGRASNDQRIRAAATPVLGEAEGSIKRAAPLLRDVGVARRQDTIFQVVCVVGFATRIWCFAWGAGLALQGGRLYGRQSCLATKLGTDALLLLFLLLHGGCQYVLGALAAHGRLLLLLLGTAVEGAMGHIQECTLTLTRQFQNRGQHVCLTRQFQNRGQHGPNMFVPRLGQGLCLGLCRSGGPPGQGSLTLRQKQVLDRSSLPLGQNQVLDQSRLTLGQSQVLDR